ASCGAELRLDFRVTRCGKMIAFLSGVTITPGVGPGPRRAVQGGSPVTDAGFFRTVGSATEQAVDTAVGGGAVALDVVRRPQGARRRGARVTDQAIRDAGDLVDDALALPERIVLGYLRGVRRRARRQDVLGLVSRGVLTAVKRPAGTGAGFFDRAERATEVATPSRRRPSAPAPARKAGRTVK